MSLDDAFSSYCESLYSAETEEERGDDPGTPMGSDDFMESLVRGTAAAVSELDGYITVRAEHWRLERMPIVDRNILRMAIYEMKYLGTAPAIVIDEALELARRYSNLESVPFVNGVLDAVRKLILPEP